MQTPFDSDCSSLPATATPVNASPSSTSAPEREAIRADLVLKYGVTSFFVRVKVIAEVMGLSATSIHALIRQERFPLPHRRVGKVVLVHFESLVDWCCSKTTPSPPGPPPPPFFADQSASEKFDEVAGGAFADGGETARERGERIKLRVLATMKRKSAIRQVEAERCERWPSFSESKAERGARINDETGEKLKHSSRRPPS